ncbi:hypothetical protein GCM10028801_41200 [Nocardioides maradonensis]
MTSYTATVPAFVRATAGTVMVNAGEDVPNDVLPSEVDRLVDAGVLQVVPERLSAEEPKPGSKAALEAEAAELGLDTSGTRAELADRIAKAKA